MKNNEQAINFPAVPANAEWIKVHSASDTWYKDAPALEDYKDGDGAFTANGETWALDFKDEYASAKYYLATIQMSKKTQRVSLDNGRRWLDVDEVMEEVAEHQQLWGILTLYMDDETRDTVARELTPCSNREFLERYLELAPSCLIAG